MPILDILYKFRSIPPFIIAVGTVLTAVNVLRIQNEYSTINAYQQHIYKNKTKSKKEQIDEV